MRSGGKREKIYKSEVLEIKILGRNGRFYDENRLKIRNFKRKIKVIQ